MASSGNQMPPGTIATELLNQLAASQQELRNIDMDIDVGSLPERVASQFDTVGQILIAVVSAMDEIKHARSGDTKEKGRKNLGESKCISGLKTLG